MNYFLLFQDDGGNICSHCNITATSNALAIVKPETKSPMDLAAVATVLDGNAVAPYRGVDDPIG